MAKRKKHDRTNPEDTLFPEEMKVEGIIVPAKLGRKTKYTVELAQIAEAMSERGCTNREIIKTLCCAEGTFYQWLEEHEEFSMAVSKGRGVATMKVENALYKNALGYEVEEVTQELKVVFGPEGMSKQLTPTKIVTKHIPGKVEAQIYILNNRKSDRWKSKVETTIALGADVGTLAFAIKRHE